MHEHGESESVAGESNRQPLVMQGARQVGKTWLVRELAKQHGLRLVEINFERAGSEVTGLFRAKDPQAVGQCLRASLPRFAERALYFCITSWPCAT